jgi:PrgI family protein
VDAPDRILAGLTSRQVAVLAVAAATAYLGWHALHRVVPASILIGLAVPLAGLTFALVVGRRDGLGLDAWLAHAVRYARAARRLVPIRVTHLPAWAPALPSKQPTMGVLRLPADAIKPDGVIRTGTSRAVAVVAATTVNATQTSAIDEAGLVAGFAGWLNSLTGAAQVVVSSRRVDLAVHATHAAETADQLANPALAGAAVGYAQFLLDLAETRQPLARAVTVTTTGTGADPAIVARRAAGQVSTLLAGLGATSEVLDGAAVTALLTGSVDPYAPGDASWPRTPVAQPVSGPGGGGPS